MEGRRLTARKMWVALLCVFGVALSAAGQHPIAYRERGEKVLRSPNGALAAHAVSVKQRLPYGASPTRIEIRDRHGRLIAERDHSFYPNQGLTIEAAGWTRDSGFFVYSATQSGGHQPWQHPTFFFSRKTGRFYSLDDVLSRLGGETCIVTEPFSLRSEHGLRVGARWASGFRGVRVEGDPDERRLTVDLKILERRLSTRMSSTDREDIRMAGRR